MVPWAFHVPPLKSGAGQMSNGVPPVASTFFNVPLATKASHRPSADQNESEAPSV
jgi:hypothetical protein